MKYPKITALVPQGEYFEEAAASMNEGIYLTSKHMDSIESQLAGQEAAGEIVAEKDQEITQLKGENTALESRIQELEDAQEVRDARIQELEAENKDLGKQPSGTGSSVSTPVDESPEQSKKPSYLSDDSAINQYADRELRYRERFKN